MNKNNIFMLFSAILGLTSAPETQLIDIYMDGLATSTNRNSDPEALRSDTMRRIESVDIAKIGKFASESMRIKSDIAKMMMHIIRLTQNAEYLYIAENLFTEKEIASGENIRLLREKKEEIYARMQNNILTLGNMILARAENSLFILEGETLTPEPVIRAHQYFNMITKGKMDEGLLYYYKQLWARDIGIAINKAQEYIQSDKNTILMRLEEVTNLKKPVDKFVLASEIRIGNISARHKEILELIEKYENLRLAELIFTEEELASEQFMARHNRKKNELCAAIQLDLGNLGSLIASQYEHRAMEIEMFRKQQKKQEI